MFVRQTRPMCLVAALAVVSSCFGAWLLAQQTREPVQNREVRRDGRGDDGAESQLLDSFTRATRKIAASDDRLRASLQDATSLQLSDVTLLEALLALRDQVGFNLQVDRISLDEEGLDLEDNISIDAENVPTAEILDRLLHPREMAWAVHQEAVNVTTRLSLHDRFMLERTYDVRGLLDQPSDVLKDLVFQLTDGPWIDLEGEGGTLFDVDGQLIVRQTVEGHADLDFVLSTIARAHRSPAGDQCWSLNRAMSLQKLAVFERTVSLKHDDVNLSDAIADLSRQLRVPIKVDRQSIEDEGLSLDDHPVSVHLSDVSFLSAIRALLPIQLGLTLTIDRQGQLRVASMAVASAEADMRIRIMYDVRDLRDGGVEFIGTSWHDAVLATANEMETSEPISGFLVAAGSLMGHIDVATFLQKARANRPRQQVPVGRDGDLKTEFYAVPDLDVESISKALPKFVHPETWAENGGQGDIHVIDTMIVVRQSRHVHRGVSAFLSRLRRKLNGGPLGMPGGGFTGGFGSGQMGGAFF